MIKDHNISEITFNKKKMDIGEFLASCEKAEIKDQDTDKQFIVKIESLRFFCSYSDLHKILEGIDYYILEFEINNIVGSDFKENKSKWIYFYVSYNDTGLSKKIDEEGFY